MSEDRLSVQHFKAVWAEIQGRFFSAQEAEQLKGFIDERIIADPHIREEAAKTWE